MKSARNFYFVDKTKEYRREEKDKKKKDKKKTSLLVIKFLFLSSWRMPFEKMAREILGIQEGSKFCKEVCVLIIP